MHDYDYDMTKSIPVVDIYLTGTCNLRCEYCFGEPDTMPGMERLVFARAVRFAQAAGATAVEFCGGEPLLYKDLDWAIAYAKSLGLRLILRTNGHFVTQHLDSIALNFDAVGISLDGDAEGNYAMRPMKGRGDIDPTAIFETVLQSVFRLREARQDLRIILASVISSRNTHAIARLARVLVRRGAPVDLWKMYQFVSNNYRSVTNRDIFVIEDKFFEETVGEAAEIIGDRFDVVARYSSATDGSCIVIDTKGDVLSGSEVLGSVVDDDARHLIRAISAKGIVSKVAENKFMTYKTSLNPEVR